MKFRKIGAVLLSAAVFTGSFSLAPLTAMAAAKEDVTCDISKGDVTIGGDALTYTDAAGELHEDVALSSLKNIIVTGETKEHTVKVQDYDNSPIRMTFRDLSIDVTEVPNTEGEGFQSKCAVYFSGESTGWAQSKVILTLEGQNTIKSLDYAGIGVARGEILAIDGEGSLDVSAQAGNSAVSGPAIGSPISNNNPPAAITDESIDVPFGTIVINGGNITASSDTCAIGGGQRATGGSIIINGGTINAVSDSYSAAGIGCGQDALIDSILITGGDITATGSNAGAGIGTGGMHTDCGSITITGGNILAKGGNYAAGIGGCNKNNYGHGDAYEIVIAGGNIEAYGGIGAAGIGGGAPYGVTDKIKISGGNVESYGGQGQATAGVHTSRSRVDGKMVFVEDGTQVTAYAPGAGIGNGGAYFSHVDYTSGAKAGTSTESGQALFGNEITVTGGTVKAYKGTYSAESQAVLDEAGLKAVDADSLGNGGYYDVLVTEDNPYVASDLAVTNGTVYAEGVLTMGSLAAADVAAIEDQTFTGKAVEPAVTVTLDGQALAAGQDYTVEYADNTAVGTATAVIKGQAGFAGEKAVTFAIVKADNPMTAKGATKTVKLAKVKKAKQTIAAVAVKNAAGKVTYKKASGKFAVNTKNGKITVPKGTKKGTYKIKVKVTAAGNDSYNKLTKTVTATIKVK